MNKYLTFIVIIVLIALVALMIWFRPETDPAIEAAETAEIAALNDELNNLDLSDNLEAEFQTIDQEIEAI